MPTLVDRGSLLGKGCSAGGIALMAISVGRTAVREDLSDLEWMFTNCQPFTWSQSREIHPVAQQEPRSLLSLVPNLNL